MELLKFVSLSVVLISMVSGKRFNLDEIEQLTKNQISHLRKDPREGQMICVRLSKEPYFRVEMVLNRTWRIYYTWNVDLEDHCMDMVFRNATPLMIHRAHKDMSELLKSEPYWDATTILVSIGRARNEMLLFADREVTGRFQGVPNIMAEGSNSPLMTKTLPLLYFNLKLMYGGKYLLMSDCQIGVTTLSANRRMKPHRAEIAGIANTLDFGRGQHACMADKKQD